MAICYCFSELPAHLKHLYVGRWLEDFNSLEELLGERQLLVDADVLIDYLKTDESILPLAGRHVGILHVTSVTVAEEVQGLDPGECARLGLQIVELDLDQIMEASATEALSFKDRLCLLIARDNA